MILMTSIFRSHDGLPMCASTDVDLQVNSLRECHKYVKLLSKRLTQFPDRSTLRLEGYNIHMISALDQTYMVLTEEAYPTVLAFCFLDELQREFLVKFDHNRVSSARRPYAFMQFDPYLHKTKQRYNSTRNLATRINLSDMSQELKLRPAYQIQEDDLDFNHGSSTHIALESPKTSYRPAFGPERQLESLSMIAILAVGLNIFCGLLNLVRGMVIISHGHFDAEDGGAYKHGGTFLFACLCIAYQVYQVFIYTRWRQVVTAVNFFTLCLCITYVAHFRNILQVFFHMATNVFITMVIYRRPLRDKLPSYTV